MSISKKIRFEIFKRDGFRCQYCGCDSSNPEIVLEIDHIIPVSKGGLDDTDNLLTACFSCNRGKSDNWLTSVPLSVEEKWEKSKERELQYQQYIAYFNEIEDRIGIQISSIEAIYNKTFTDRQFTDYFRLSIRKFLKLLHFNRVIEAMHTACLKDLDNNDTLKYFCGICWRTIKEKK